MSIDSMRTILTIWTQPKKTFEYLDKNGAPGFKNNVDVLFYIGSLALALPGIPQMVLKYKALNDLPMIFGILFSIIGCMVGAFFGALIFKYVHSYLLWIIGKGLQGQASKSQVQLVIAYSLIPGLISLLISIILIIIALFLNDINVIGYQNPLTLFIIWIFAARTLIYGIATFNRFTYGYALLNLVICITLIQGIQLLIKHLVH